MPAIRSYSLAHLRDMMTLKRHQQYVAETVLDRNSPELEKIQREIYEIQAKIGVIVAKGKEDV